ncbi:MAG: PEP-CTERM sorting domain-containing protein [Verrucomicrobiae bacterium]|nr:PEP-CTERM sorting domain-containing protein [Verrucomicrobiae bacterium]
MITRKTVKQWMGVMAVVGALAWGLTPVGAAPITLKDENSVLYVDPALPSGVYGWEVDGVDNVWEHWFWYRIGSSSESSLASLPIVAHGTTDTNFDGDDDTLFVRYELAGVVRFNVRLSLDGGSPGSNVSDLAEQIQIRNLSGTAIRLSFFQYTDFDLFANPAGDSALIKLDPVTGLPTEVVQWKGSAVLTEVVLTPDATCGEISESPQILAKLTDFDADDLSNTFGPVSLDDVTWALQWDFTLAPGQSVLISKDLRLVIPEPTTAGLVGLALLGVATALRRRA